MGSVLFLSSILIISLIIYLVVNTESDWNGIMNDEISYLDSLYYTMVTTSTIGFEDITPKSKRAKCLTLFIIFNLVFTLIF